MKKLLILPLVIIGICGDVSAAARATGRASRGSSGTASGTTATAPVAARAARAARTAPAATASVATAPRTVNRGRAATTTPSAPTVKARAGAMQKVVGTGTKVAAAAKNVAVNEECLAKYEGCMDAFCMLDNETGGRCICSDKNAEFDSILAEIEKLDQQSYQMATFGVEKIEMGADADAVIANANAAANSVLNNQDDKKKARKALDLSMWDMNVDFDTDSDVFGTNLSSPVDGKEGDALHRAAAKLCADQIPECAADLNMLQMMYGQRIKSDCAAYENSLKQQKNASQQKLYAAESALREAALEQFQNANKYDLGQCTIQFKKCMQTTGGCGDDFSSCAMISAMDHTNTRKSSSKADKGFKINGAVTTIEISASTYDALSAKKPLCEHVTKSCVNVADQVWDTFLREVAPQVKAAELIAEDNARQSCIGNISDCFQKACKDNMDPNDPDGSYDLCLTRPESMMNLCKVPLNACGIDEKSAEQSDVWDFVVARLAAMRVDACTTEVKKCLTADDRCGTDFNNCIGLDMTAIKEMCPLERLVSCQTATSNGEDVDYTASWDNIERIVRGIFLNIDNAMLTQCQAIVSERMIELCGDTMSCEIYGDDISVGMDSLASQQRTDGDYVISGLLSLNNLEIKQDPNTLDYYMDVDGYMNSISDAPEDIQKRIKITLDGIRNEVNRKISMLKSDPQVDMCINGRDMTQIRGGDASARDKNRTTARFPALLGNYTYVIANSILDQAKQNYDAKYALLMSEAMADSDTAKNLLYCQSLVHKEEFDTDVSNFDTDSGIKSISPYEIIVAQSNIDNITKLVSEQSDKSEVILDTTDRMIAHKVTSVAYEPGSQVCRITTTTYPCTGFEAIYNSEGKSFGINASVGVGAVSVGGGFNRSKSSTKYGGNFCNSYAEPVVSEQLVNLANGTQAAFANTTRSNLTSYYQDSSYTDNSTTKGTSIGVGLSTGDLSNIGNTGGNKTKNSTRTSGGNTGTTNQGTATPASSSAGKSNLGSALDNLKVPSAPLKLNNTNIPTNI